MKLSWNAFCIEFCTQNYIYTFSYNGNIYTIGNNGEKSNRSLYYISTQHAQEHKDYINLEFGSPQTLLTNAMIQGKPLATIWNDITME